MKINLKELRKKIFFKDVSHNTYYGRVIHRGISIFGIGFEYYNNNKQGTPKVRFIRLLKNGKDIIKLEF